MSKLRNSKSETLPDNDIVYGCCRVLRRGANVTCADKEDLDQGQEVEEASRDTPAGAATMVRHFSCTAASLALYWVQWWTESPMKNNTFHTYLAASCLPMAGLYNICHVTTLHQKVQSGSLIEHRLVSVCLHGTGDTGTNAASQEAGPCPFIKSTRYLIIIRDSEFCSLSIIILHLNSVSICRSSSSVLAAADQVVCR